MEGFSEKCSTPTENKPARRIAVLIILAVIMNGVLATVVFVWFKADNRSLDMFYLALSFIVLVQVVKGISIYRKNKRKIDFLQSEKFLSIKPSGTSIISTIYSDLESILSGANLPTHKYGSLV